MERPFFSIAIPTKNRPEFLRDAILSVLLQNFDDYELIISDNFNDQRTKKVIDEFKENKHLNYVRSDKELNMPDSWEFATKKSRGVYTLILADRAFLKQGALKDLYNVIRKSKEEQLVYFWPPAFFDEKKGLLMDEKTEKNVSILKSVNLIESYIKTIDTSFLPIPTTGCYRFDIAQKIRKEFGRLCPYSSPDAMGVLFLAYLDSVAFIHRPFIYFQGSTVSNLPRVGLNPWPYFYSLNMKNPFQFVPIKAPIVSNCYFNDFLTIKNNIGKNLKDINVNLVLYFTICYEEIIGKMTVPGTNKKIQLELLQDWKKAFYKLDKKTKNKVLVKILLSKNIFKSYLRSSFFGEFLFRVKRFLMGKPIYKKSNALEAGGFNLGDILGRSGNL